MQSEKKLNSWFKLQASLLDNAEQLEAKKRRLQQVVQVEFANLEGMYECIFEIEQSI